MCAAWRRRPLSYQWLLMLFSYQCHECGQWGPPSFACRSYQWFLVLFSLRPGRYLIISAQRLPTALCMRARIYSSRCDQGALQKSGLRSFFHFSRHCLPIPAHVGSQGVMSVM